MSSFLLYVHNCRLFKGRDDHEDRSVDTAYAVNIDRDRYVVDEYKTENDLGEVADSLRKIDLPGRIVVLFVSDRADDVKYCSDKVGAGNIDDQYGLRLVQK